VTQTHRFRFRISTPPTWRRRPTTSRYNEDEQASRIAADLEAVFDVPVQVSAVLGRSKMDVGELLKLGPGTVLELDRRVGEAIDIYVNNRLVARGEGGPGRGQARRDHDGNHQVGTDLKALF